MTATAPSNELTDDPRVIDAARKYFAELEGGHVPSRLRYYALYPELHEELAQCFDGIELAHAAGLALKPTVAPVQLEIPAGPLGDFQIVREIGRGGMGVVYEAVQISLNRRVALKVLPFAASLNEKQLQRFKTESYAAAQLHHTNIVPVYAVGYERGIHFYAMQLIDGRSLEQVIGELRGEGTAASPSSPTVEFRDGSSGTGSNPNSHGSAQRSSRTRENARMAARIAAQVADALDYAHEAGVVHRDIKPANLLIDGNGTVWIADFGLAQIDAEVKLTQTGDIFGTLRYMSPEKASGRRSLVDNRTDVYSLGVTLYELLALEPLFAGDDRQELLQQILHQEPRPLRDIDRSIPADLETIVLKALAKAPEDRYQSAGEMAADLKRFLDERTILARRPSVADRMRKWRRRHPSVVAAGGVFLVFIAGVLGLSTALIAREQGRTEDAKQYAENKQKEAERALAEKTFALEGEEQARLAEKKANDAERERLKLAQRAVDELIRLADVELASLPGSQGLRKRMFDISLTYYREFVELSKDDADAQAKLAETQIRIEKVIGDLLAMQGARYTSLLKEAVIVDELKLTENQKKQIPQLVERFESQQKRLIEQHGRKSAEERTRRFLEFSRAADAEISNILTAEQKSRLGQLHHQCQGLNAYFDPYVIAELNLTENQRESVKNLANDLSAKKILEIPKMLFRNGRNGGMPAKEHEQQNLKHALQRAEKLLKPEQLKKWKELVGEPLKGTVPYYGGATIYFLDSKVQFPEPKGKMGPGNRP